MLVLRNVRATLRRRVQRQYAIFGWMGLPMVLIFLLSAAWTSMLAAIQLAPTAVANYLMGTKDLDFGEFWLLARADDRLAVPAAALLMAFAVAYLCLALRMVFVDELLVPRATWWVRSLRCVKQAVIQPASVASCSEKPTALRVPAASLSVVPANPTPLTPSPWRHRLRLVLLRRLVAPTLREFDNSALALPKLLLQSTTLIKYLRDGFPIFLILNYATLLTVNWFISCDHALHKRPDPRFVLRRIFFSFDLFFAVLAPLLVLVYAYNHFAFARDVFATRTATLIPGTFDRTARLFADPTQVSLFRIAFQTLQLTSATSLGIKTVLNVFTLRKWHGTIATLVAMDHRPPRLMPSARRTSATQSGRVVPQRPRRPRCVRASQLLLVVGFACLGAGLFVYTAVSVVSSQHVCRAFPHCQVPSYRWNVGAQACSCVVFVDREMHIGSYAAWRDLADTTANLAALATTGDLRFVQIINRQVPRLPDELQRCQGLEQLILIHTRTLALPDWTTCFTNLQYLNMEGDLTSQQLTYLPPNLLADMPHLQFLHLGSHLALPALPSFGNLPRLRYLVLAMLHAIHEIPHLDHLYNLRQLNLIDLVRVAALPSITGLTNLNTFVLVGRNPVCCNGFLTDVCNLTEPSCLDRTASGEPLVECTPERVSRADDARLKSTQGVICAGPPVDAADLTQSYEMIDTTCGGVEYRQCAQPSGAVGMCFPERMNPIACQSDPGFIAMRRLQIERSVGDACDPVVEAWLGCTSSSSD